MITVYAAYNSPPPVKGLVRDLRRRRFDLTIGFTEGDRTEIEVPLVTRPTVDPHGPQ